MAPGKAQQLGHELASLAASISEIAEDLITMGNADHSSVGNEPASQTEALTTQTPTLEEVRGILADKASTGHREAVQALIHKHGAQRLSDIDPSEFDVLITEARAIQ
ncbi:MAG TPA: DNA ligase [Bacilli bacterium]|nr:DNA ligase [Bacilli bacterium]